MIAYGGGNWSHSREPPGFNAKASRRKGESANRLGLKRGVGLSRYAIGTATGVHAVRNRAVQALLLGLASLTIGPGPATSWHGVAGIQFGRNGDHSAQVQKPGNRPAPSVGMASAVNNEHPNPTKTSRTKYSAAGSLFSGVSRIHLSLSRPALHFVRRQRRRPAVGS